MTVSVFVVASLSKVVRGGVLEPVEEKEEEEDSLVISTVELVVVGSALVVSSSTCQARHADA